MVPAQKNWSVESILVTTFCCLPFGIVGIVNAASVNSKFNSGHYDGALNSARRAEHWAKAGFGFGLALLIIWIIWLFRIITDIMGNSLFFLILCM
jgi:hypothetical protein